MKGQVKRNHAASPKNHQQTQKNARNEAVDHGATGNGETDAHNTPRQTGRSGRKSRDNFGSYKGY